MKTRYLSLLSIVALCAIATAQVKLRLGPDDIVPVGSVPVVDIDQHIADAVDRRIAGLTAGPSTKAIYTVLNSTSAARSNTCWAKDIDLSAIAFWQSRHAHQMPATAITSDCAIGVNHAVLFVGDTIKWVGTDNTVYTRTITTVSNIAGTDISLYELNLPLPSAVKPLKILAPDYASKLTLGSLPLFSIDQERNALVRNLASLDSTTATMASPTDAQRLAFYEGWTSGDSSSPACAIIDGELVLVSIASSAAGGGTGHNLAEYIDEINAALNLFGSANTVANVTLPTRQKVSFGSIVPALGTAATKNASEVPTAGQIPLIRQDTGKLSASTIPDGLGSLVDWADIENRPPQSRGGSGAADSGKLATYDSQGFLYAARFSAGYVSIVDYHPETGVQPPFYEAMLEFTLASDPTPGDHLAFRINDGFESTAMNVYYDGRFEWLNQAGKIGTLNNLGMISTTTTWNPASLANGASEKRTAITLTGAAAGDVVVAQLSTILSSDWAIQGVVTATDTAEVKITNNTGGTVDLPSGTLRVIALKF